MSNIRTATLEITLNCNFRCDHCYIETTPRGGDVLSSTEWIKAISRLIGVGCKNYILTGGEVLMCSNFSDIYRYLKKNGCRVDIFTNGSILKKVHKELFTELPPDSVSVTLYGRNSEQYQAVTGCSGPVRELVEQNIATLRSMGIHVNLGAILCKGLGVNTEHGDESVIGPVEMNTYMIPALHRSDNLRQRLPPQNIIDIEIQDPRRDKANRILYSSLNPIYRESDDYLKKCSGGHSSLFVSAMGLVSTCAIYRAESINILDEKISTSDILKKLAGVHERFRDIYFSSKCGTCGLNRNCRNCPAYSILETGLPGENPYLCELARLRADHYLSNT